MIRAIRRHPLRLLALLTLALALAAADPSCGQPKHGGAEAISLVAALSPASGRPAVSNLFDMVANGGPASGCYVESNGPGAQFDCAGDPNHHNDFSLINEDVVNGIDLWEFWDGRGCFNAASNTGVFENSCHFGDTTEEWFQPAGTRVWENVHRGTQGFLNVDCSMIDNCPETLVSVAPSIPWATDAS